MQKFVDIKVQKSMRTNMEKYIHANMNKFIGAKSRKMRNCKKCMHLPLLRINLPENDAEKICMEILINQILTSFTQI